jgi:methyl coenzyme M reductase subunit D
MATEGHRGGQDKDHQQKTKVEIDKELIEIRAKMERLALKMQQDAKVHWTYEWPLKRKVEWPVQKLMARRQQQMLRRWLRHAENLSNTGRKVIYICEPEVGKILSDDEEERLDKDLINCQVGQ